MSPVVKKPEQELSITEIIGRTFNLYTSKFIPFYIIFLIATLVNQLLGGAVRLYFVVPHMPSATAPPEEFLSWFSTFIVPFILLTLLTFIISWIITTLANGMAVKYTSDILEKGDASLNMGLNFTVSKLPSLFVAGIISAVLIGLGLIALVIPGIIIAIMFSLVVQVIIIQDAGAFDSFGKSRGLVRERWLKTFGLFLILVIITFVIDLIGNSIGLLFGPASWVVNSLVNAFVQPILPIAFTLFYYSMTAKEAGFTRSQLPPPPPPAAPSPLAPIAGIKFCPYCGGKISPETVFCPHCGKKIRITV